MARSTVRSESNSAREDNTRELSRATIMSAPSAASPQPSPPPPPPLAVLLAALLRLCWARLSLLLPLLPCVALLRDAPDAIAFRLRLPLPCALRLCPLLRLLLLPPPPPPPPRRV